MRGEIEAKKVGEQYEQRMNRVLEEIYHRATTEVINHWIDGGGL